MKESKEDRKERQAREEWAFAECLRRAGNQVLPEVELENEEHPSYPFRIDYLINSEIAVEIQGIGFGHHSFSAIQRGYRKCRAIASLGLLYVPVTRQDIADGQALEALSKCGVRVTSVRGKTFPVEAP